MRSSHRSLSSEAVLISMEERPRGAGTAPSAARIANFHDRRRAGGPFAELGLTLTRGQPFKLVT
jgi:hypothetical protein